MMILDEFPGISKGFEVENQGTSSEKEWGCYQQKMEGVYYLHLDSTHKLGDLTKIPTQTAVRCCQKPWTNRAVDLTIY